ncbi:MAG: hypothetical protein HQK96_04355 [Nitrospirae bacterium]|nr:hypothetical protein [Nitrospirota bacterium]
MDSTNTSNSLLNKIKSVLEKENNSEYDDLYVVTDPEYLISVGFKTIDGSGEKCSGTVLCIENEVIPMAISETTAKNIAINFDAYIIGMDSKKKIEWLSCTLSDWLFKKAIQLRNESEIDFRKNISYRETICK